MLCSCMMSFYCPIGNNWTALFFASDKGHVEIVHLLINHSADVDIRDKVSKVSTIVTVFDILLLLNNHCEISPRAHHEYA